MFYLIRLHLLNWSEVLEHPDCLIPVNDLKWKKGKCYTARVEKKIQFHRPYVICFSVLKYTYTDTGSVTFVTELNFHSS